MKKIIPIFLSLIIIISVLPSCGKTENTGKINIVTTIFPVYDWVRNIVGENSDVEVTMLIDNGVDLHSFQPTADDIIRITASDLFLFVGGESDEWAYDMLENSKNKINAIDLMDLLGDLKKEEVLPEGATEEAEEEEETEYDEHIWLSLKNAKVLVKAISSEIEKICGEGVVLGTEKYIERIEALDGKYTDAVSSAKRKTLLFADRFPFLYMTDDYGLKYYAAFSGCSAESEASFETVTFLAGKIAQEGLTSVITLDGGKGDIAKTVISSSGVPDCKTLVMNSMQSVTKKDADGGADYLNIMNENLKALTESLN